MGKYRGYYDLLLEEDPPSVAEGSDDESSTSTDIDLNSDGGTTDGDKEESSSDDKKEADSEESSEGETSESEGEESSDGEESDSEDALDDGDEEGDEDGEGDTSNNSGDENHKKYMLLKEYKDMLLNCNYLTQSLKQLKYNKNGDGELSDTLIEIIHHTDRLSDKIKFFITHSFAKKEYNESLTNFMFLRKEQEVILDIVNKILKKI